MGGFGDDDDDDAITDFPDESDDLDPELESDQPAPTHDSGVRPLRQIQKPGKRRVRLRPMPPKMRAKHPDTVSITITRSDGRQLIFVK